MNQRQLVALMRVFYRLEQVSGGPTSVGYEARKDLVIAMKQLQDMGASYFILDLRDNLGGLIQAGIEVAKLFLNEGETIIYTVRRDPQYQKNIVADTAPLVTASFWRITKLIVLVKLLLLHFMITVELFLLRRGLLAWFSYFPPFHQIAMKFRLPTGKYVTPNQLDINGNGVEPDYRNFPAWSDIAQHLLQCNSLQQG